MSPRALALLLAPTITLLVLVGRTEAGIVVLEDGRTIVAKFGPEDVTAEELHLRSVEGTQSAMKVERRRVRWFDPVANEPTDAYFDAHVDEFIEARWERARQGYLARKQGSSVELDPPPFFVEQDPLGKPLAVAHLTVRPPRGWLGTVEDDITMLVAAQRGERGYAPRLHVFSTEAPRAGADEQARWIEGELRRLGVEGGYEVIGSGRLREVPGGFDQTLRTVSRTKDGRVVKALRRICFRAERTYFFAAYADEADFDALDPAFERCLGTFTPDEDVRQP